MNAPGLTERGPGPIVVGMRSSARGTLFITQIAVMTAVSIVIGRLITPHVPYISLAGFPLILSGLVLGPAGGAYVGALADIIGAYMVPLGAYNPFYTITSMLTACVPVLVVRLLQRRRGVPTFWLLLLAIFTGQFLTKVVLFPVFRAYAFNVPWWASVLHGAGEQALHVPLYALLARAVMRALPPRLVTGTPPRAHVPMPSPGLVMPSSSQL